MDRLRANYRHEQLGYMQSLASQPSFYLHRSLSTAPLSRSFLHNATPSPSLTRVILVHTSGAVHCAPYVSRQPATVAEAAADDVMTRLGEQSPLMTSLRAASGARRIARTHTATMADTTCHGHPVYDVKIAYMRSDLITFTSDCLIFYQVESEFILLVFNLTI